VTPAFTPTSSYYYLRRSVHVPGDSVYAGFGVEIFCGLNLGRAWFARLPPSDFTVGWWESSGLGVGICSGAIPGFMTRHLAEIWTYTIVARTRG
jgi:hypothetical protein